MKSSILITVLMLSLSAGALAFDGKSAHREANVSYLRYKYLSAHLAARLTDVASAKTAQGSAQKYGTTPLASATVWDDDVVMLERFKHMRDVRWMLQDEHPGFLRRTSWLFPDDGCFARAGLAIANFFKWKEPVPSKVFVFGDLQVHTTNSPYGSVSWWYHVAPVVEVKGEKYVLDPAIEPNHPLKLEEWLKTMGQDIHLLEVSICAAGAYAPFDACAKATDGVEAIALNDQPGYLSLEWERLETLKRDPSKELADNPPW